MEIESIKDFLNQDIKVGIVVMCSDGKGASIIFGRVTKIHGDEKYPVVDIDLLFSGGNFDKSYKMKQGTKKNLKVIKKIKEGHYCTNSEGKSEWKEVENEYPYVIALTDEQTDVLMSKLKNFTPIYKTNE